MIGCPLQYLLLEKSVFEWDATCCVLPYCLRFLLGGRVTETLGTGTVPRHANSTPHLPGNPVANNSCPLRPYHTEYNYIVLQEMGNLIQIREGRKTFSSTQYCLYEKGRALGNGGGVNPKPVSGDRFQDEFWKKIQNQNNIHLDSNQQ